MGKLIYTVFDGYKKSGMFEEEGQVLTKTINCYQAVYFYNLSSGGKSITKKMVLSK